MPAKQRVARTAKSRAVARPKSRATSPTGALPEWNLDDLYAGIDDPQVKRDLDRADAECVDFEQA
jgi:oligoendopeptidase F